MANPTSEFELRVGCSHCTGPMVKAGKNRSGTQKWACFKCPVAQKNVIYSAPKPAIESLPATPIAVLPPEPKITIVEEHRLQREVSRLKAQIKDTKEDLLREATRADIFGSLTDVTLAPPEWLTHMPAGKTHHGTIIAMLSDTHLDEVVSAREMNFVNAYNREIALLRIRKFFGNVILLTRDYIAGVKIDGLQLLLGGDIVSGNIHEELKITNEAPILDTCVYWAEQIAAGIEQLLGFFPKIHVTAVPGNHGRLTKKPSFKNRVRDNYDWLIYKLVEKHFRGNTQVTFQIPDAPEAHFQIYNLRNLLVHGDQGFSGGNGIGGLAVPIMRGDAKKQKAKTAIGHPYDVMWMGHWHVRSVLGGGTVRINGTTKGWDEYAAGNNFDFQQPQQALAMVTPERGITLDMPVFVRDKHEEWN